MLIRTTLTLLRLFFYFDRKGLVFINATLGGWSRGEGGSKYIEVSLVASEGGSKYIEVSLIFALLPVRGVQNISRFPVLTVRGGQNISRFTSNSTTPPLQCQKRPSPNANIDDCPTILDWYWLISRCSCIIIEQSRKLDHFSCMMIVADE